MSRDQIPFHGRSEQTVEVDVRRSGRGLCKHQVVPVANAGHELDPEQIGDPEDRGTSNKNE